MVLLDTNILIEVFRNNSTVIATVGSIGQDNIAVSDVTCAELYFGARNKAELQMLRKTLSYLPIYHVNTKISEMAVNLVEQYCLSHKLDWEDALIAATAIHENIDLCTLNPKDFIFLHNLKIYQ